MRVNINSEPFADSSRRWHIRGLWPAEWISFPFTGPLEPNVVGFRKVFDIDKSTTIRIHVSADERYELYLDGELIGRGPERGDVQNWFYESYDINLNPGKHIIAARVWWLGDMSPYAQMSVRPGFLLAAENQTEDLLNTGKTDWECKQLQGYCWKVFDRAWGVGAKIGIDGNVFDWGFEKGEGDRWQKPAIVGQAAYATLANEWPAIWRLRPAMLPEMLNVPLNVGKVRHIENVSTEETDEIPILNSANIPERFTDWNKLLSGESKLEIPAGETIRVIVDLENYYCAYPEIIVSGGSGAKIRIYWAESLFENTTGINKGNRNEIEGKYFHGVGDWFKPDGGENRKFGTLWWEVGRYLEIIISTKDSPLVIDSFRIHSTHYPYEFTESFKSSDPRLEEVIPIAKRVMQMCSHETYMDCPYIEQLMYIGDTRLETLTTYALTRDDRLPRKALFEFNKSRLNSGITQSRYPSRVTQVIPPFSLWWIAMVHDYAMWRNDPDFISELMPGVRNVIDTFCGWRNSDGLIESPNGWNFIDWVPGWENGMPPGTDKGISGIINWQAVMVFKQAAQLEKMMNEPELAKRADRLANEIAIAANSTFWSEERKLFANDVNKTNFSEHSQCLSLLGSQIDSEKQAHVIHGLLSDKDIERTTIYFSHYLFETYGLLGRTDLIIDRMGLWFDHKKLGMFTTLEMPEPSRSDCHAWGAHPVFHYFATILGIRPGSPGFREVILKPQLGNLKWANGTFPHPEGDISVEFRVDDTNINGTINLPDNISGNLIVGNHVQQLKSGKSVISVVF